MDSILKKFYSLPIGGKLYSEAKDIITEMLNTEEQKILLIGYGQQYISLMKHHNVSTLQNINTTNINYFDKIIAIHCIEQEKDLQYMFNRLHGFLIKGGDLIILTSKMYSTKKEAIEINFERLFYDINIAYLLKKCRFTQVKKIPLLTKYHSKFNIPFLARFVVIHAKTNDNDRIVNPILEIAT